MDNPDFISVSNEESTSDYIPGVCNIGPAEIKRRQNTFYMATVGVLVLSALFLLGTFSSIYYILAIIVIFAAGVGLGVGFLQWYEKFCIAFGILGVFNFEELGPKNRIEDNEALRQDREKVKEILIKSVLIGLSLVVIIITIDMLFEFPTLYSL